ncbi:hypothetical protein ED438_13035 [Salmonella enterica subsp. enterica serovar Gaminara]|nr:hypothetical protein [Salmonella enterica subsp. enterica serovar Gaminara]
MIKLTIPLYFTPAVSPRILAQSILPDNRIEIIRKNVQPAVPLKPSDDRKSKLYIIELDINKMVSKETDKLKNLITDLHLKNIS